MRAQLIQSIALACLVTPAAWAQSSIIFSTQQPAAVDGPDGPGTTQFSDGTLVEFNTTTGIGTIFLLDDTINDEGLPDTNAVYIDPAGNVVFSTQSSSAGFSFQDDQLVQYNPVTDTLSLFYDFGGILTSSGDADIQGFHVLPNGNYLIANRNDFTIDGQSFSNGDIVEFDPIGQTASLYFAESLFGGIDARVSAVSMLANGNLLLAATNEGAGADVTLGGLTFGRGDVVEYNLATGTGSLFMSGTVFGGATEDIDALHAIPIPAAVWLFASALLLLGRRPG